MTGSRITGDRNTRTRGQVPLGRVVVPGAGLEPARPYGQGILNPQCLPFHHPGWTEEIRIKRKPDYEASLDRA